MMLPWWDNAHDWWGRPRRRPLFDALTAEQVAAYRITYGGYEDDEPTALAETEPRDLDVVAAAVEIAGRRWDEGSPAA